METKIPPHNLEAEQNVLGAILINDKVFKKIGDLKPNDFYRDSHKKIFFAMQTLNSKKESIDLLTVSDYLDKAGHLEQTGGATYLSSIANAIPTSAQIKAHTGIVKEKSHRRTLMQTAIKVLSEVDDAEIDELKAIIKLGLKETRSKTQIVSAQDLAKETLVYVEDIMARPNHVIGMPTGFKDIDFHMGGLQKTDLIIIAGRPGMGKSGFLGNIIINTAKAGNPVGVFALEMGSTQTGIRHLSDLGDIPLWNLNHGIMRDYHQQFIRSTSELAELPIYYCFEGGMTMGQIVAYTETMVEEYGVRLITIDYLQLIKPSHRGRGREEEVAEISKTLKLMAKEYDITVICLAQLNRSCESREDKRPLLSDLRESGAIEQDADMVIFLYRDDYYRKNSTKKGIAECIFSKGRHIKTGVVKIQWQPEYTRFQNLYKGGQ